MSVSDYCAIPWGGGSRAREDTPGENRKLPAVSFPTKTLLQKCPSTRYSLNAQPTRFCPVAFLGRGILHRNECTSLWPFSAPLGLGQKKGRGRRRQLQAFGASLPPEFNIENSENVNLTTDAEVLHVIQGQNVSFKDILETHSLSRRPMTRRPASDPEGGVGAACEGRGSRADASALKQASHCSKSVR